MHVDTYVPMRQLIPVPPRGFEPVHTLWEDGEVVGWVGNMSKIRPCPKAEQIRSETPAGWTVTPGSFRDGGVGRWVFLIVIHRDTIHPHRFDNVAIEQPSEWDSEWSEPEQPEQPSEPEPERPERRSRGKRGGRRQYARV